MLKAGDSVERCVLVEQLRRDQTIDNIQTWRAVDQAGLDVVLRIYRLVVSDSSGYGGSVDLTDEVAGATPDFERLVSLPERPGVAKWLWYQFDPNMNRLILCRRYYPARLMDQFGKQKADGDSSQADFLRLFEELAIGLDGLADSGICLDSTAMQTNMSLNNVLMESRHAFISDSGLAIRKLESRISDEYGMRLVSRKPARLLSFPELYLELRAGSRPELLQPKERESVLKAFASNVVSCREFVKWIVSVFER